MIKNLRHVAIVVSNLEKQRLFYENFFGFQKISENIESGEYIDQVLGINSAKIHWVKLKTPNGVLLELVQYLEPRLISTRELQLANQFGHSHLAFTVDEIAQFVEDLSQYGARVINQPVLNPEKTVKVCYIHDPEGNILEIVEDL